jgi:hypothetical protein
MAYSRNGNYVVLISVPSICTDNVLAEIFVSYSSSKNTVDAISKMLYFSSKKHWNRSICTVLYARNENSVAVIYVYKFSVLSPSQLNQKLIALFVYAIFTVTRNIISLFLFSHYLLLSL